jgi:hypothetical protein
MRAATLLVLALCLLGTACTGEIRETTTARSAEEMVHISTAAERSVARMNFRALAGKKVFVDERYLKGVDRGFVMSCVHEQVVAAGMQRVKSRENADVVLELRCAGLGTYDYHLEVGLPDFLKRNPFEAPPDSLDELPTLFTFGYTLHEGWGLIQAFGYERTTGKFVFGSTRAWGRSYKGLSNDIDAPGSIVESLKAEVK